MRALPFLLAGLLITRTAFAACADATIDVCFRPGAQACDSRIVAAIEGAQSSLLVQAYNFTNPAIIQAIGNAKKRGLEVRVLLDKENRPKPGKPERYTGWTYLKNAGVPVKIDDKVAIAHNKIVVVDNELTIGGSYNYTKSAEDRNAENATFTRSACVADLYRKNFDSRWGVSKS